MGNSRSVDNKSNLTSKVAVSQHQSILVLTTYLQVSPIYGYTTCGNSHSVPLSDNHLRLATQISGRVTHILELG